jgi:hypothetical protein
MVRRYRAMGRLCRQQAVFHPAPGERWLGETQRRDDLAHSERILSRVQCFGGRRLA